MEVTGSATFYSFYFRFSGNTKQGAVYLFDSAGQFKHKFTASDGQSEDRFGFAVASYGKVVVIGARGRSKFTGAAYVFDLYWKVEVRKLTPTDGATSGCFGTSIAVYGNNIMVSANNRGNGAVYTFDVLSGELIQIFTNTNAPNEDFGHLSQLGIHPGSNVGIAGYSFEDRNDRLSKAGAVYLFDLHNGTQLRKVIPAKSAANMYFGHSLLVSGDFLLVGAPGADSGNGRVYVFDINANWIEITFFGPSDNEIDGRFGASMALSGSHFIISTWRHDDGPNDQTANGAVYIGNIVTKAKFSKFVTIGLTRSEIVQLQEFFRKCIHT